MNINGRKCMRYSIVVMKMLLLWVIIEAFFTVICIKFAVHRTFLFKNSLTSILGARHSTFYAVRNSYHQCLCNTLENQFSKIVKQRQERYKKKQRKMLPSSTELSWHISWLPLQNNLSYLWMKVGIQRINIYIW